jgi:S1-C subfamily serine protease
MNRCRVFAAGLTMVVLLGLTASATWSMDDEKTKDKPKDAPTLDDQTGTLTQTVDGKEKKTELDLKYCLKVKGYFSNDGFHIEEVDSDGPATRLSNADGQTVGLEKGDIITEVDGKRIKSPQDYAKAMNGTADHAKTKIKVRDVRTGNEQDVTAEAAKK